MGAEVHGFSLAPPSDPSFFEIARVAEGMTHLCADLRDAEAVGAALKSARSEIVLHLGAQALVRQSYLDPAATVASNVTGTVHLLEALRATPSVRAVLVVTSDKCYENREWLWPYRENEPMGGRDPYSASKGCVELLTAAWRDSYLHPRVSVATARAGNVIGGGDWAADRLIPDALRAWEHGETLAIRNPLAVRPWQYHLDALAGYLTLAAGLLDGKYVGAWNFGPTDADMLPVEGLLKRFAARWKTNARWETPAEEHPHEAMQLRLDSSKARALLGWKTRFDIDDSLEAIVAWLRAWRNGNDMRAFSLAQIRHYSEKLE